MNSINRPTRQSDSKLPFAAPDLVPARCAGCFRPPTLCYCSAVPSIDNQTDVLILQHVRERDHAFNTARMVQRALAKSKLVFGTKTTLAAKHFDLAPDAGLLFPTDDSVDLAELSTAQRPSQLVLIDGTWAQAKTIVNALPQLQQLRRYKLSPNQPGQYRIRLEPTDTSLSTVEATVAALQALEPQTPNLDQLLVAFDVMVQKQLDHPAVGEQHYSGGPKSGRTFNIPKQIFGDPRKIIVAYGEANYRLSDQPRNVPRNPVYWCAENLGTGEQYKTAIEPENEMTDTFLKHLGFSKSAFENSKSLGEFCESWREFCGDAELLLVYNHGTIRLLENAFRAVGQTIEGAAEKTEGAGATAGAGSNGGLIPARFETLKSINYEQVPGHSSLPELIEALKIPAKDLPENSSRAVKRLTGTIALVRHLQSQGDVSRKAAPKQSP